MTSTISRRDWLRASTAAWALAPASLWGFPAPQEGETALSFLDEQPIREGRPQVRWQDLESWITPVDQFFSVAHYGYPETSAEGWKLEVGGLVRNARSYTLGELQKRPRRQYTATLECSGNGSSPGFLGGIGNARWAGTPLAPLLKECGLQPEGIEVVFYGADEGTEKIRGGEYQQHFARSLAVPEALKDTVLVAWEMNGAPLGNRHGGPLRLVVPGWYGVAWVKWMNRIEVQDRRFESRFMGRDYVTIRGEERGGATIWRELSVGRMNLKSIVGRVTRRPDGMVRVTGAAWSDGTPLKSVELRIDDGPWTATRLGEGKEQPHCWTFWSWEWRNPPAGEHTLVSRAIDARGRIQPAKEEPAIQLKKTYWEANQQYPRRITL